MKDDFSWRALVRGALIATSAALLVPALSAGVAPMARAATPAERSVVGESAADGAGKPETPAPSVNPFTTAAMRAYLASRRGGITGAVLNLANHKLYLYRPGVTEQTASIVKVDILETLLHAEQASFHPLDGDDEALATGMIEASDNDDATDLWDEVGGAAAIARFDALAGLTDTMPNTDGYWGETMTTALDQVRLLERLVVANTLLDRSSRAYELGLMENVIPYDRWGVCAGPAPGVTVALKNGWVPIVNGDWQINSIGYVSGDGRDYLVAILTDGNPTEGYGIATIEGISRIIWSRIVLIPER
jgi:hypothetical protein